MIYLISILFGLALGSFANVCILRLPNDKSVRTPRSYCPHCGRTIKAMHNIPLLSFLALKGRCSYCRAPISWQYPLIEALMATLFAAHVYWFGTAVRSIIVADALGFYLLTLSIIDYRHRIIPDELSISLLVLGLLGSFSNPFLTGLPWIKFTQSLAAALGGGLLMLLMAWAGEKVFKKEAMGGGDIKLIAATAAVLGWQGILGPLLIGSIGGGAVAMLLLVLKKKKLGEAIPFGPFLSLGAYVVCLFPGLLPTLLGPELISLNFP